MLAHAASPGEYATDTSEGGAFTRQLVADLAVSADWGEAFLRAGQATAKATTQRQVPWLVRNVYEPTLTTFKFYAR